MSGSCRETTRISGSGREAHPDVWEWSGGPFECPGVVREALSDARQWS